MPTPYTYTCGNSLHDWCKEADVDWTGGDDKGFCKDEALGDKQYCGCAYPKGPSLYAPDMKKMDDVKEATCTDGIFKDTVTCSDGSQPVGLMKKNWTGVLSWTGIGCGM